MADGDILRADLNVRGQRVPMDVLRRRAGGGRDERVEVVDLQMPSEARGRDLPACVPGEIRTSVERDREPFGTMQSDDQRLDFRKVASVSRELEGRGCGQFPARMKLREARVEIELPQFEFVGGHAVGTTDVRGNRNLTRLKLRWRRQIQGEGCFCAQRRSSPAGFDTSFGAASEIQFLERILARGQSGGNSVRGNIFQAEANQALLFFGLLFFLCIPRIGGSERLRRKPVCDLRIAGDGSAEQAALQLDQFQILLVQGQIGVQVGIAQVQLLVVPVEVLEHGFAVGGELGERSPVAFAVEIEHSALELRLVRDVRDFSEIEAGGVGRVDFRLAEIGDMPAGINAGIPRGPAQRAYLDIIFSQREASGGVPGKRTKVLIFRFDAAEGELAFVAVAQKGIDHGGRDVGGLEVEGDFLVVPEKLAATDFDPADGKREQLLDGSVLRRGTLHFRVRQVGASVGIDNQVDDRMFEDNPLEAEAGFEQRDHLDAGGDTIDMRKWNLVRTFKTVQREVANLDLQPERDCVVGAEFDACAGRLLQGSDDVAPHIGLEGIGRHVPGGNAEKNEGDQKQNYEVL